MKKFSQLALPYIVWAIMMLLLPMGLIALYSFRKAATVSYRSDLRWSIMSHFLPTVTFC